MVFLLLAIFSFIVIFKKIKSNIRFGGKIKKILKNPDCPAGQPGKVTPFNYAIASFRVEVSILNATNREPISAAVVAHDSIASAEEQEARGRTIYGARPVETVYTNIAERTITVVAEAC